MDSEILVWIRNSYLGSLTMAASLPHANCSFVVLEPWDRKIYPLVSQYKCLLYTYK